MQRFLIPALAIAIGVMHSCTDFHEEEAPVSFGVDVKELSFPTNGDSRSVTVTSGKKWDVSTMPEWIRLQSITRSGLSPYEWSALFTATTNEEYSREGMIVFKAGTETVEFPVSQEGKKGEYVAVESFSISPSELTMTEGDHSELSLIFTPSSASVKTVSWKSSVPTVASVSQSGRVDAIAEGTTIITATTEDGKKTASCSVTVKAKVIPVTGVTLDKASLSLTEGNEVTLTATVSPSNATDKSVTWSSSNTSVASVSSNGLVTAKASGSATITVKTNDGGKAAKCSVTVSEPTIEAIDLGLSVKWGSFNLGAKKPEEYGNYYAWGEIETKSSYSWSTYKWCNGSKVTLTKYNTDPSCGTVDNKTVLDSSEDVAKVTLGDKWRIPTYEEWKELQDKCTWTWTTKNGVNGYVVSATNGNSIFFPCSGFRNNSILNNAGSFGYYWSSSLYTEEPYYAWDLIFDSSVIFDCPDNRFRGQSIRPVYGDMTKVSVISVSLNQTSVSMVVGNTQTLTATVSPSNATDKSVTWSSSNTSVATVSSSGVVTAKSVGEATITVKTNDGGYSATCIVRVYNDVGYLNLTFNHLQLIDGMSYTMTASSTTTDIEWSSDNPSVASVSTTGVITTKSVGQATITARAGNKEASCVVYVYYRDYRGFQAVDLGLTSGLKWASHNIGASKPEEYGDYFAWGETESKSFYDNTNYIYYDEAGDHYYKYYPSYSQPYNSHPTLEPQDDAAHVKWGGSWKIPTWRDIDELIKSCYWEWSSVNGVEGYLVTSKTNGNSIFLPVGGEFAGTSVRNEWLGYYWTSSANDNSHGSNQLIISSSNYSREFGNTWSMYGAAVRAVSY